MMPKGIPISGHRAPRPAQPVGLAAPWAREDLAWAAGIFDGEGSAFAMANNGKRYARLSIGQADREMLDRFAALFPWAKIRGPFPKTYLGSRGVTEAQPQFALTVNGYEGVQAVMAALWTWLGAVKRTQFVNALAMHGGAVEGGQ